MVKRCAWVSETDKLYCDYHDLEWGVPEHDDTRLFEMICLEGAQAGLSWRTILAKREGYRRAFLGFDINRVAAMNEAELEILLQDSGIVRHAGKIASVRANARVARAIQEELGSLDTYFWAWVDGKPKINLPESIAEVPAKTDLSDALSKDLKKRGMKFVGSTTVYAFMQAAGLVNDHEAGCFRAPT